MKKIRRRPILGICFAVLIIMFCFSPQFRFIYSLPPHLRIIEGESALLQVNFPLTIKVSDELEENIHASTLADAIYAFSQPVLLKPVKTGKATVEFNLLGFIPLRTVQVDVLPTINLIPGGQSIGVVLHSRGVIVVGNSPILSEKGQYVSPAKEAGINVGDVILSLNGVPAQSDEQVAEVIDQDGQNGEALSVLLKRGAEQVNVTIHPVMCAETRRYRIGLFVRDSAAGVGTLTFYEPKHQAYGALGHIITDNDTNQPVDCEQGKIVMATVSGIQQGKRGQPGEKIGLFFDDDEVLGSIQKNTEFGIYGKLTSLPPNPIYSEAMQIATMNQIQMGPAEILTVIDGQNIERFSIDIQKINIQDSPDSKGLVIKVTDPRLLEKTGGIVQGMSGSPIIQNGKLVGAVTHVFVHDPTKGYGCFIDWMLMDSGIIKNSEKTARNLFTYSGRFPF
ncbi:MAG: SpoIVB peptidase [Pelosinus sp.]|nr:SpoIVB peptidase [Pelosinus sp.]